MIQLIGQLGCTESKSRLLARSIEVAKERESKASIPGNDFKNHPICQWILGHPGSLTTQRAVKEMVSSHTGETATADW